MSTTTDLNTLVINYLTEAQYEAAVQGGTIDPDQLYLTPDAGGGSVVTDVEVDGVSVVTAGVASVDLTGKSDVGHTHTKTDITDFPSLATVATSGSYSDLSNKPTIPTITDTYSGTSSNGMSGKAVKSAIDALDGTISGTAGSGKTLTAFSQTDGKVSATFGNISITKSQVSDFPTIPTVNNATLTIQKNGTNVKTFTANASSDVTANITVPTKVSDLTNDSGFITSYTETDPVFSASAAAGIQSSDITAWNGKSTVSVTRHTTSGTNIADLTINGTTTKLYAPTGGGGTITDVEVDGTSVVSGGVAEIDLTGKSDVGHTHTTSDVTDFPSLATVATSGSYSDLSNKPTIPTITDTYSGTSSNGMSGKAVKSAIDALDGTISGSAGSGKTLTAFSQTDGKVSATFGNISITKSQVSDFPTLATVATSGSYSDLSNKPSIPTITDTYSGTSSNGMSGKAVKSAIDALDGTITGSAGSSKTLTAFSQTDGKVSATFDSISITKSQVSDFPTDYVEEQGTSGIWTYRKWNSGVAECWGSTTVALNINQSYGAMYWATFDQALPSGLFTSVTSAVATRGATSGSANGLVGISFHDVSTTTLGAYVYDSVAASDTWGFSFEVKGRWK